MTETLEDIIDLYLECAERMPKRVELTEAVELWVEEMTTYKVRQSRLHTKLNNIPFRKIESIDRTESDWGSARPRGNSRIQKYIGQPVPQTLSRSG